MLDRYLKTARKLEVALSRNKAKTYACANAVGIAVTAGVSVRAGMKLQKKIDDGEFEKKDILKDLWPVGVSVGISEFLNFKSYDSSAKKIAQMALELNSWRSQYDILDKKIRESVGDEKADEIEKEAKKEQIEEKTDENTTYRSDITGYWWFKDDFSGAYFYTKESCILKAWNKVSKRLYVGEKVSLNDFYYELERKDQVNASYMMTMHFGWDGENSLDRHTSVNPNGTGEMPDGSPCRIFRFTEKPHILPNKYS